MIAKKIEYSMYCEVCSHYKDCGPQKVACEKFNPSVKISSKNSK